MRYSKSAKKFNVRQAAEYFGCSPNMLQRLKRWGWLKPIETTRIPFHRTHYYQSQLDMLAYDYMYSLSMYDILFIRMNWTVHPASLAKHRGIPLKVVELVLISESAAFIVELIRLHGRYRKYWKSEIGDDRVPWDMDITAMSKHMRKFVDGRARGRRADLSTPVEKRRWTTLSLPVRNCEVSEKNVYGLRSALNPVETYAFAIAQNLNKHLPAELQIKVPKSRGLPPV